MVFSFTPHGQTQVLKVSNISVPQHNRNILGRVERLIEDGAKEFIVDLSDIDFINSTGLSFLVSVLTKTRNIGGETSLLHVSEQVSKLLVITKLQSFFNIYENLQDVTVVGEKAG